MHGSTVCAATSPIVTLTVGTNTSEQMRLPALQHGAGLGVRSMHPAFLNRVRTVVVGAVRGAGVGSARPSEAGTLAFRGTLHVLTLVLAALCLVLVLPNWLRKVGAPTPGGMSFEVVFRESAKSSP